MCEFIKKLYYIGGSVAIVIPSEIVEKLNLSRGDMITVQINEVSKYDTRHGYVTYKICEDKEPIEGILRVNNA